MKYELQTIPVWKAVEASPLCLLCHLEDESEKRNVTFFLGNSIMAPEMRVQLNEHGFCRRHFHMLAGGAGKLGYSLALRTHLDSLQERLQKLLDRVLSAGGRSRLKAVEALAAFLKRQEEDCLMCDRIAYNVRNYAYTIATLHANDESFRKAFAASSGICLHHLPVVCTIAQETLSREKADAFFAALTDVENRNLDAERDALEQFSWQFDFQSEKKTPPEAQDAIARAVHRLAGYGPR